MLLYSKHNKIFHPNVGLLQKLINTTLLTQWWLKVGTLI